MKKFPHRLKCAVPLAMALFAWLSSAQAVDYTWNGGSGLYNSINWLPGPVAGPTLAADGAIINSGQVNFAGNDTFGTHTTSASPTITIGAGGTVASNGFYNTFIGPTLNGGTLLLSGGVNASFPAFGIKGTVTVTGSSASTISTNNAGSFNRINIGPSSGAGNLAFDVADVTGDSGADLSISVPLQNMLGGTAPGLTKLGLGTLELSGANTYTGATLVQNGTLHVNGGSISGPGLIDIGSAGVSQADFILTAGSVTAGTQFVVGAYGSNSNSSQAAGTTLQVNGTFYLGGYGTGTGTGTYTQAGGTATATAGVNFGGGGPNSGIYHLDGGTLTTAGISKSGSGTATFNFNGGTLRPTSNSFTMGGLNTANVRNGGGIVDTNGFNAAISQALLHSTIGGDNAIDGGITKNNGGTLTLSGGNTFTGDLVINGGTVQANGSYNNATATTSSALGNMNTVGRQVRVNPGASLVFVNDDPVGDAGSLRNTVFNVDGGTVERGNFFVTLPNITLSNGATLTGGNGVVGTFQAYNLLGSVTVSGTSGSTITTTGASNTGTHLGNGNVSFIVNSTGIGPDLTVSAPLVNRPGSLAASGFTKTGAGAMLLTAANTYTGNTIVSAGQLTVAGSLTGTRVIVGSGSGNNGSLLVNSATTSTFAADAYAASFDIGENAGTGSFTLQAGTVNLVTGTTPSIRLGVNGAATGTLTVNGGTLAVPGRILSAANSASAVGTLTIGGGQVNLGTPGSYTTAGDPGNGVLWFGVGTSTVNLNGGTLSMFGVRNNGPAVGSAFNFNGGTLRAVATNNADFLNLGANMNAVVQSGGAVVDSNGFDITISKAFTNGGGNDFTKKGVGTLTFSSTSALNAFSTIDADIQQGTLNLAGLSSLPTFGTLKGDGTLDVGSKTVTLTTGGVLMPGNSPGVLDITGNLNIASIVDTAGLTFELGDDLVPNDNDRVNLTGLLTLGSLNFADFSFIPGTGFGVGTYTLFDAASLSGTIGVASGTIGVYTGMLSIDGPNNNVILTVVPEPSSLAMLAFGMVSFWLFGTKRRGR